MSVAIIGGTGIGDRLLAGSGCEQIIETEFGSVTVRKHESGALVLARHGSGHKVPPHKVNYRAMAAALKTSSVKFCLSSAAVGSLHEAWVPGTLCVVDDFLDLTGRQLTMFEEAVQHTDFSSPFSEEAREAMLSSAEESGSTVEDGGVYVGANGPRYETPAEINLYRQFGGDVVGMTASSEAIVMKESGIGYGCLAVVTNLAAGLADQELDHSEVVDIMKEKGEVVANILVGAAKMLSGR